MALTATITAINYSDDQWSVGVSFVDSGTSWKQDKTYAFSSGTTQAEVTAAITADGTQFKSKLAALIALQTKVGTTITIL